MHQYRVSGLALASEQPLEGLERWPRPLRHSWRLAPATATARSRASEALRLERLADGDLRLSSIRSGSFLMRRATRAVRYAVTSRTSRACFLDVLVGPVVSCLLMLDGSHPLHGSAVRIGREAVGFLGQDGAGKSTMAAACVLDGHGLLVDDVLTIAWRGSAPYVMPGYPEIRLWPGSGRRLVPAFDRLPRVVPTAAKRRLDPRQVAGGFVRAPVRLRALYELQRSSTVAAPRAQALPPRDAFLALLRHLYNTALLTRPILAGQFRQLATLAQRVPIRRLLVPRAGHHPLELPRIVLDDLRCLP